MFFHEELRSGISIQSVIATKALGSGLILWSFYLIALVVYRLYFHPLAKYPGPFWGRITAWHAFYHLWTERHHEYIAAMHRKYGTFVRVRPNLLVVNDPEALKQIYGYKANVQKGEIYTVLPANPNSYSTHSCINKQQHARKRRMLAHCFSDASIKKLEPAVIDCTTTFLQVLGSNDSYLQVNDSDFPGSEKGWGKPFDAARVSNAYTFDVMGSVTFSKPYNMLTDPENIWFQDAIMGSSKHKTLVGVQSWLFWSGIDTVLVPKLAALRERVREFAMKQMSERLALGEKDDFFKYFTSAEDPETGEKFSKAELGSESALMIIAGSDTSSTALAGAFYNLSQNPATLAKLNKEIREAFTNVDEIRNGPILSGCKYLRAVLDESMRLSPPITGTLTREVLTGGITVKGEKLPAGVEIAVPQCSLMRDPEIYEEPTKFIPERWLDDTEGISPDKLTAMKDAFCPFSIGPRGCIGRSLAYLELTIALARVVFTYDFRQLPGSTLGVGHDGTYDIDDVSVSKKRGPLLQFKRR